MKLFVYWLLVALRTSLQRSWLYVHYYSVADLTCGKLIRSFQYTKINSIEINNIQKFESPLNNQHDVRNTCLLDSKVSRFNLYFRRDSCTWCMSRFTLHFYTISVLCNLLLSPTCWLAIQLNDYWLDYWFNSTSESWWLLLIYDICSVPIYYSMMHDLKNCFVHY